MVDDPDGLEGELDGLELSMRSMTSGSTYVSEWRRRSDVNQSKHTFEFFCLLALQVRRGLTALPPARGP